MALRQDLIESSMSMDILLGYSTIKERKEKTMNLNSMFGKLGPGMCKLSYQGGIAVKTSTGYKTYNLKTKRLVNCAQFALDIADEFFFIIPTNKVRPGDIILVGGSPRCVLENKDNTITVINYEDSTVDTIVPERHIFMGNVYFYGKVVSLFGNGVGGKGGMKSMLKMLMLSKCFGKDSSIGNPAGGKSSSGFENMLPMMFMFGGNGFGDVFDGIFGDEEGGLPLEDSDEDTISAPLVEVKPEAKEEVLSLKAELERLKKELEEAKSKDKED